MLYLSGLTANSVSLNLSNMEKVNMITKRKVPQNVRRASGEGVPLDLEDHLLPPLHPVDYTAVAQDCKKPASKKTSPAEPKDTENAQNDSDEDDFFTLRYSGF